MSEQNAKKSRAEKMNLAVNVLKVVLTVIAGIVLVILFTGIICFGAFGIYVRSELAPLADIDIGTINMN